MRGVMGSATDCCRPFVPAFDQRPFSPPPPPPPPGFPQALRASCVRKDLSPGPALGPWLWIQMQLQEPVQDYHFALDCCRASVPALDLSMGSVHPSSPLTPPLNPSQALQGWASHVCTAMRPTRALGSLLSTSHTGLRCISGHCGCCRASVPALDHHPGSAPLWGPQGLGRQRPPSPEPCPQPSALPGRWSCP